jgi:Eukaryotic mitochondrial regulator protein
MIPTTPYNPSNPTAITPHEPINDLPVHKLTEPQLFYPTSESRAFNRTDAGRVFSAAPRLPSSADIAEGGSPVPPWQDTALELIGKNGREMAVLKPADSRIPHPHLIPFAQDKAVDGPYAGESHQIAERYAQRLLDDDAQRAAKRAAQKDAEEARTTRIRTPRWEFVVKEVSVTREGTGRDGRGTGSPGYRYGVPSMERKRGTVKIPTKVET